jgi:CBS domain-containing protein
MRVKDVMTPKLLGVTETASLWEALNLMVTNKVSALAVFDPIGALVGILSEGDLMRRAELGAEKRRPRWLEFLAGGGRSAREYARSHGRRVHEIMTRGVLTVDVNAELNEAIDIMMEKRVRRLVVMKSSQPVGVLSRSDIVRALMRALPPEHQNRDDAALQSAIEDELGRQSWAPVNSIRVTVTDGVATLEGAIPDDSLREGLTVLVENVAGVKTVRDHLAWVEPNSGLYMGTPGGF